MFKPHRSQRPMRFFFYYVLLLFISIQKVNPLTPPRFYHVFNGGVDISREEKNYPYFLSLWDKQIEPIAESYTYCLLKNPFHFLVRMRNEQEVFLTMQAKHTKQNQVQFLSQQFSNCFNATTKPINKMYNRTGSLFEERFQRKTIDNKKYLKNIIQYIHHNPKHHGFVTDFRYWNSSSYNSPFSEKQTRM
jgi:putative transposase